MQANELVTNCNRLNQKSTRGTTKKEKKEKVTKKK